MSDSANDTKACPYCAETIQAAAAKCRFCGEWLKAPESSRAPQQPPPVGGPDTKPRSGRPSYFIAVVIVLGGGVLLLAQPETQRALVGWAALGQALGVGLLGLVVLPVIALLVVAAIVRRVRSRTSP